MKPKLGSRSKALSFRFPSLLLAGLACLLFAKNASAEVALAKTDGGWEVFFSGRVNSFLSFFNGQQLPRNAVEADGITVLHDVVGGGLDQPNVTTRNPATPNAQGTLNGMRVRSGFLGNVFGFGVRRKLGENNTITGYIESWAQIESAARRKFVPVPSDVRQGFLTVEGPWGKVLAGRALSLFSRGATLIDFDYGHGFAVGHPGSLEGFGPTNGHIGTGVLAAGFAAGFVYTTPSLAGLQLNLGYYDPINLPGAWERTKYGRPEAELTFDVKLGKKGRLHLFGNGGFQDFYHEGSLDSDKENAYGAGYGGRLEVGPVRIGASGYAGKGLGLTYAFENSEANFDNRDDCTNDMVANPSVPMCINPALDDRLYALRRTSGYHVQAMLVLGPVDLSFGYGASFLHRLATDAIVIDHDQNPDTPEVEPHSLIKSQTGYSAVLLYHVSPNLHLAADFFRVDYRWYLGERQVVNFFSTGMTVSW